MSFIGICNVNRLPFNVPVLTQCVVCEMADIPCNILSPDVIRQLQAATEEDDPTAQVSSYKYDWWKFNKKGDIEVFNVNTVMSCLEHHWNITGKVAPTYLVTSKYSMDAVIDLCNEILPHTTTALNRVYTMSRRAAGLYMLWQASTKQVQETEDLEHETDPSWVLLQDAKKLFKPVPRRTNIGSAFAAPEESAIGPAIAATLQYIPPDATLSAPPCANTGHEGYPVVQVEYSGNTQDPAYGMELSDDGSIAGLYGERKGDQLRPYAGNTADPAFHMERSDEGQLAWSTQVTLMPASLTSPEHIPQHPGIVPGEPIINGKHNGDGLRSYVSNAADPAFRRELSQLNLAPASLTSPKHIPQPPGIVPNEVITKTYPGNELDPTYEMDLSDNDWDPSAGLVLSDNEDVAADMELSDDEGA
ncbi:hypothetical protein DXG01_002187 [Tephrocybe rancida]|nr:hypothetical protein DXG01_002187 [Tephrocybe rancida]